MRRIALLAVVAVVLGVVFVALANRPAPKDGASMKIVPDIEPRVRQFVTAPLATDLSSLTAGDRKALARLVEAARITHGVFQRQAWRGAPAFAAQLARLEGPGADARQMGPTHARQKLPG